MKGEKTNQNIRNVVQTGLLIALALVIRNVSYMVYIGGAPGMRISFSGIFTKLAAVLFGPVYGGAASGILDLLGYLIKPEGTFIPWLTVTAILGGVITGIIWTLIKNNDSNKLQKSFLIFFVIIGIIGLTNHISVLFFSNSSWAKAINYIGKSKDFATIGLEVSALIGLGLFAIDAFIQRKQSNMRVHESFLKLLISTGVSNVVVTTLNTYILMVFIPALGKKGFMVFWVPRLIQEILMAVISAYIMSYLLYLYNKVIKR